MSASIAGGKRQGRLGFTSNYLLLRLPVGTQDQGSVFSLQQGDSFSLHGGLLPGADGCGIKAACKGWALAASGEKPKR